MSNIKAVRIFAHVPFDFLNWHPESEHRGLPESEIAAIAGALFAPSTGLTYDYVPGPSVPNSHGGHTQMYALAIGGEEALAWPFLERLVRALRNSGEEAQVHIAEAMDVENCSRWENIGPADQLTSPQPR